MARLLSDVEFGEALRSFDHTAFRLELQPAYFELDEHETFAKFLIGEPENPTELPDFQEWFDQVRELSRQGKRMQRVRVHEDPPTDYQRWERWIGRWNIAAGERIRYTTRKKACEVGLLPAAGDCDWWLLDSRRLIVMTFDGEGRRLSNELVTDASAVVQACAWRDLAVHHSAPENIRNSAA